MHTIFICCSSSCSYCKAKLCPVRDCPTGHNFINICHKIVSSAMKLSFHNHVNIYNEQYFVDNYYVKKCLHEREINQICYDLPLYNISGLRVGKGGQS